MKDLPTFKDYILSLADEQLDAKDDTKKKKKKKSKKEIEERDLPLGILKYLQIAAKGDQ